MFCSIVSSSLCVLCLCSNGDNLCKQNKAIEMREQNDNLIFYFLDFYCSLWFVYLFLLLEEYGLNWKMYYSHHNAEWMDENCLNRQTVKPKELELIMRISFYFYIFRDETVVFENIVADTNWVIWRIDLFTNIYG